MYQHKDENSTPKIKTSNNQLEQTQTIRGTVVIIGIIIIIMREIVAKHPEQQNSKHLQNANTIRYRKPRLKTKSVRQKN